jgi:hypothetical protein
LICSLTSGATLAEIVSLEELFTHLMRQSLVPPLVIQALWDIFGANSNSNNLLQKNGALLLLGMMGAAAPSVLTQHISTIVTVGLSKRSASDEDKSAPASTAAVSKQNHDKLRLARTACIALQKIKASELAPKMLNTIFSRLTSIIRYEKAEKKRRALYRFA